MSPVYTYLAGLADNDILMGAASFDYIFGNAGDDTLMGLKFGDQLFGVTATTS
ncbi:hypothetical protein [Microcoleus sp. herbarium2]|uniref:hypothetical protein n=1 Tax=Microcoleus sp. herbarium2 TaxID=3055433 RepID=UPI002FCF2A71